MVMKISWREHETKKLHLVAHVPENDHHVDYVEFFTEDDLQPIWEWCAINQCGTRVSFDMFKFRTKKQITMFLLRWS